jgi:glycosyltransferase involved in cell wall biosynthesis
MKPGIHINGKWLSQATTGTQRYANEIVKVVVASDRFDMIVHLPRGTVVPRWLDESRAEVRHSPYKGVLFEQVYLPSVTSGALLLNFAGPAPLFKRRQLVTMHDANTFRYPKTYRLPFVAAYYLLYSFLGRTADQLVTVSGFSARELAEVLRISADRFLVVHCAADALLDTGAVRPQLELDEKPYLVVGTLAHHKNLASPVAAVAETGRPVVVVGVSDQQVFSATAPLDERAVLAGRLTDEELVWMYRNARALIFPSKYEGFGLPPLEAQVLGCPVVCSNAASLPEVCGDGALYFDPDDTTTLLAQLDRIEHEPGLADELRRRGSVNASGFTWDDSAHKIMNWLSTCDSARTFLP